jgi:hypothetical protein
MLVSCLSDFNLTFLQNISSHTDYMALYRRSWKDSAVIVVQRSVRNVKFRKRSG